MGIKMGTNRGRDVMDGDGRLIMATIPCVHVWNCQKYFVKLNLPVLCNAQWKGKAKVNTIFSQPKGLGMWKNID